MWLCAACVHARCDENPHFLLRRIEENLQSVINFALVAYVYNKTVALVA